MRHGNWNERNTQLYETTVNRANNTCTLNIYRTYYLQALHKKNVEKKIAYDTQNPGKKHWVYEDVWITDEEARRAIETVKKGKVVGEVGTILTPDMTLEMAIAEAGYWLREITFHSDGRIIAKTGGNAPHPKKLYKGKTATEAVLKLIVDNKEPNPCGKPHNNGEDTCNECLTIKEGI